MRVKEIEAAIDTAAAGFREHEEMILAVRNLEAVVDLAPDHIASRRLLQRIALAFGISPQDVRWIWSQAERQHDAAHDPEHGPSEDVRPPGKPGPGGGHVPT